MQAVGEIPFIAGHVALDFVNTAEERGHPDAGDALRTVDDLRLWGQRRGVIARGADSDPRPLELPAAVEARELLYRLFLCRAGGRRAQIADLSQLSRLAATAYQAAHLNQEADGRLSWSWDPSQLATVRHVAVTSAVQLLIEHHLRLPRLVMSRKNHPQWSPGHCLSRVVGLWLSSCTAEVTAT